MVRRPSCFLPRLWKHQTTKKKSREDPLWSISILLLFQTFTRNQVHSIPRTKRSFPFVSVDCWIPFPSLVFDDTETSPPSSLSIDPSLGLTISISPQCRIVFSGFCLAWSKLLLLSSLLQELLNHHHQYHHVAPYCGFQNVGTTLLGVVLSTVVTNHSGPLGRPEISIVVGTDRRCDWH